MNLWSKWSSRLHIMLYFVWLQWSHLRESFVGVIWGNCLRQSSMGVKWGNYLRESSKGVIWGSQMRESYHQLEEWVVIGRTVGNNHKGVSWHKEVICRNCLRESSKSRKRVKLGLLIEKVLSQNFWNFTLPCGFSLDKQMRKGFYY